MNEISLLIKLIIFDLVIFFFWYLATFSSFQIIHFVVVKIMFTIVLILQISTGNIYNMLKKYQLFNWPPYELNGQSLDSMKLLFYLIKVYM